MGISWWPKSSAWAPFLTWSTLPRTRTSLYKISCLVLSSWPSSSGASSSPLQSTWLRSCLDWLSWSMQCGLSMLTSNLTTFFSATHLHLQGDLTLPTLPSAVSFSFLALDWGLKVWTPLMAIVVQARTEPSVDWLWESNRPWAGKSRRPSPIFWGPTGFHFWILLLFFIHFSTGEVSSGLFWHCGLRLLSSLWQIYWGEFSLWILCYFIFTLNKKI